MSGRIVDLAKARHIRTSMRDVALLERVANTGLDRDLYRVGGIRGLLTPSAARGTFEERVSVYKALLAFGITESEMLEALTDSLVRRGESAETAALNMQTTMKLYRAAPDVVDTLKRWGVLDL